MTNQSGGLGRILLVVLVASAVLAVPQTRVEAKPGAGCSTWYVAAGGTGDGESQQSPFGSLAEAEAASGLCDSIAVLPGTGVLDGGIVLKDGQTLVGRGADPARDLDADPGTGSYSLIANTSATERDGHAVTCLGECSIDNIWITAAFHSGVSAVDGAGDVEVNRSRVSNFNTGGDDFRAGVSHTSGVDGALTVTDSVIESGNSVGILSESFGDGDVSADVRSVVVRDVAPTGAAPGYGILLVASGASGAQMSGDVRSNAISGVGEAAVVFTSGEGPNQASAVIRDNEIEDAIVGIKGVFQSDSVPDVDHMDIRHNDVAAFFRGIVIEIGADVDPRARDHRGDWVIAHNDVKIVGPTGGATGIELAYESSTASDTALVRHNTVVSDENAFLSVGIVVASASQEGRAADSDITVRHNDIRMAGPLNAGMGFVSAPGAVGPVVPDWDLRMLFEHNCVADAHWGFAVVDGFGLGFATETYDLGGGDLGSVGRNAFLGTAFDIAFLDFRWAFGDLGDPSTPSSPVIAEGNYWDTNNPVNSLEAVILDEIGTGVSDTEPFLSVWPTDCKLDGK